VDTPATPGAVSAIVSATPTADTAPSPCVYPDGSGASWRSATDWTLLWYQNGASGPIQFTQAGLAYLGVQPVPPVPLVDNSPPPSDSNLAAQLVEVNTLLGRSFPEVRGQVCNSAHGWAAADIAIRFAFYYNSLLPTLDSGTAFIDKVNPGDCSRFNNTLYSLTAVADNHH
jgi:hypothetical protein